MPVTRWNISIGEMQKLHGQGAQDGLEAGEQKFCLRRDVHARLREQSEMPQSAPYQSDESSREIEAH